MLILMKQYGKTIVCGIIGMLVFSAAFGFRMGEDRGFIQMVYRKAAENMTDTDMASDEDADALKRIIKRKKPEIDFAYQKIFPGVKVNMDAMFLAWDADENPVATEIRDISDMSGNSMLYLTEEDRKKENRACDTTEFVFPYTGVYLLKVRAVDAEKKVTERQYKIPVTGS